MTRMSKQLGGGTRCPDCNGRGFREFCHRGKCVDRGFCRTCMGYGYTPAPQPPTAKETVSRIVRRHEPMDAHDIEDLLDDVAEAAWERQIDTQMGLL